MKHFFLLLLSFIALHVGAIEIDSVKRMEMIREGQTELCNLLEYNEHAADDQKNFVVVIDGNDPIDYVVEKRLENPSSPVFSQLAIDSINAELRRTYTMYHIELYMIMIEHFNIIVSTPAATYPSSADLFTRRLFDQQTNLVELRNQHISITNQIIDNTFSSRNRDCLIYSKANYVGAFVPDKTGSWMLSKIFTHRAATSTYTDIDLLADYFYDRTKNNTDVTQAGIEFSFRAVAHQFYESAKFMALRGAILTTLTSSGMSNIFFQFNETVDYESLTVQERTHALAVFTGWAMMENGVGIEERYACRIVETTPSAQVNTFLSRLAEVSPLNANVNFLGEKYNKALVVVLLDKIDDVGPLGSSDNYARFMRGLTNIALSSSDFVNTHLPTTDAEWMNRQIYWDESYLLTTPPIGTHNYAIGLNDNGTIDVSKMVVKQHVPRPVGDENASPYQAIWDDTYEHVVLNPFDLVLVTNRSSLAMISVGGAAPNEPYLAPAIFLKYCDDKEFNTQAVTATAVAFSVVGVLTGPASIISAVEAGNVALAVFEGLQFVGASADLVANVTLSQNFKDAVNTFNLIVGIWGITRVAVSSARYSIEYLAGVKAGTIGPVPIATAETYRAQYAALTETELASVDAATREEMRRLDELLGKEVVGIANTNQLAQVRASWLSQLEIQYGPFNTNNFHPDGLLSSSIPTTTHNQMLAEYPNTLSAELKEEFLSGLIKSGSSVPQKIICTTGDVLYKIVPEGQDVTPFTPFFVNETELLRLETKTTIEQELGLPLSSHSINYDIYRITANEDANVFESICAPTNEVGYHTTGGATQTLVIDRSKWSAPVKLRTITPPHE